MDCKAQGALEYLLLIGGAILIAAVVIVVLTGLAGPGMTNNAEAEYNKRYNELFHKGL